MKTKFIVLFVIFYAVYIQTSALSKEIVDPTSIGIGARALGMGRAFAGLADDSNAIYINPAGIATYKAAKISSFYSKLLNDVDYLDVSGSMSTRFGSFGLGYLRTSVSGIEKRNAAGSLLGNFESSNNVFLFSYAIRPIKYLSLGTTIKLFKKNLDINSGTGMDMDFGVLYKPANWCSVGLSAINILPESLGAKVVWDTRTEESIPAKIRLGFSFKMRDDSLTLLTDIDYRLQKSESSPLPYYIGLEYFPVEYLALRTGCDQGSITGGLGLKFAGLEFDYAYHPFNEVSSDTTHFFSVSYTFPQGRASNKIQQKNIKFADVPSDYWAGQSIQKIATLNIMKGFSNNYFYPGRSVSRAELACVLANAKNSGPKFSNKMIFSDVSPYHWAAPSIKWAADQKILRGYPDGTFRPNKPVTLSDISKIIARFDNLPEGSDIFNGRTYNPQKQLRRDQLAVILTKTKIVKDRLE